MPEKQRMLRKVIDSPRLGEYLQYCRFQSFKHQNGCSDKHQ